MKIEDIKLGLALTGLDPVVIATVAAVPLIAEGTISVIYKTLGGAIAERLLNRADEPAINIATSQRPWAFDGDGDPFKLAVEAKRIDLAFLFDPMMAVHTSNVDQRPYKITALTSVGESRRSLHRSISMAFKFKDSLRP